MMKASGKLLYGVQVGDAIHYDYTVTLPVIRHTVNALAATGEAFEDPDSAAARMYYRVAVIAEVFESLGTLAKGEITPEILLDGLTDDDMDIIDAELAGLKKRGCSHRATRRPPTRHPHPRKIRDQSRPNRRHDGCRADGLA